MDKLTNQQMKPIVGILGTFHMENSTDLIHNEMEDIFSKKRQEEIEEVCQKIKSFKPTKLAFEYETIYHEKLNKQYSEYIKGNFELGKNEVYQIGFRLAKAFNHTEVYCVDWMGEGVAKRSVGEVTEWLQKSNADLYQEIFGWVEEWKKRELDPNKPYQTILEKYQEINRPEELKENHRMYVNMARIKEGEDYIGLDWLLWWYQRNLILFSNLTDLAKTEEDRVLFIVGGGHVEIVSNFLKESGLVRVEMMRDYLH
jgi:hypothetical protein